MISYSAFAKLRYLDFFPDSPRKYEESGVDCLLGLGGLEGWQDTYFAWPQHKIGITAEISLDFRKEYNTCPTEIAMRVLGAIRLPIAPGMSIAEIENVLGKASKKYQCTDDLSHYTFRCSGEPKSKYEVLCFVNNADGLTGMKVVRMDLMEK